MIKFQNLCRSGKSANLHFTSSTGKVFANLSVQVGELSGPAQSSPVLQGAPVSRNGPSQVRRRQKRAEARRVFAEEAMKELSAEEVSVLKKAEKVEKDTTRKGCGEAIKEAENAYQEVADEICSDAAYKQASNETEEVDADELARDKMVEKVIVYAVTEPIEKKVRCGKRNQGQVWKYWC